MKNSSYRGLEIMEIDSLTVVRVERDEDELQGTNKNLRELEISGNV